MSKATKAQLESEVDGLRVKVRDALRAFEQGKEDRRFLAEHQEQNERMGTSLERIQQIADAAVSGRIEPRPGEYVPEPRETLEVALARIAESARVEGSHPDTFSAYAGSSEQRDKRAPRWRKV